jgi:hypothetical protein
MADLTLDGSDVVVRLSAAEAVLAWRREVRVPIAQLKMVRVEESPLSGLSRWRLPGVYWPGSLAVGRARCAKGNEFAVAYAGHPAVVLEAEGGTWQRLVVSHKQATAIAAEVAALLLGRGPGGTGGRGEGRQDNFPAAHD